MAAQTIFWKHPYHGEGFYTVDRASARDAGEEAADELPGDFVEDDGPEYAEEYIRQDLTVKVWTGVHTVMPDGDPDYELV